MHIIIGLISAVAGLLWAINSLQNSGFRISSLNPFLWMRRNKWKKQYAQSPLFMLENPMDAAAAVLLGVAKLEGEISKEQKREILAVFSNEFKLGEDKAKELFASTSFMLQSENNFLKNLDKVLEPSKAHFTTEQSESIVELVQRIAKMESAISAEQDQMINKVVKILLPRPASRDNW